MKDLQQMQAKLENQKGFTLVEIAIVLVIIGLLLGGVLKGQEMINSAKIKSDTDTLVSLQAAAYAYKDRTGAYPGTPYDPATAPTASKVVIANATTEASPNAAGDGSFFADIFDEGFTKSPNPAVEHETTAFYTVTNAVRIAGTAGNAVNQICINNIEENVAFGMDQKLDDGIATTGNVRMTGTADTADWVICLEM
ncbi:prepilin-type N-terminal cleavage/methylation domain-containing protein [Thiomicrorhabdus cannonii]|uniref:prepilin-type N-terminal cleavage/methylation domain-containing protein n=1 Tax=Thiomicrorhabdus cannonii TaxID=2748011 RepID=UPI001C4BB1C2|nr:prepilin-type N-terminal cleavage/methylation domain-containing protein [Thiomicrorhabdus cannonii]